MSTISGSDQVDASALSKEAGILVPTALTEAAWRSVVEVSPRDAELGQDESGRLWDVLCIARLAMKRASGTDVQFTVLVAHNGNLRGHRLKANIGPGDAGEPVITMMLPDEN